MLAQSRRAILAMCGRITVCVLLALWAAHRWLAPICPPDLPWLRISEIILVLVALQVIAWLASVFLLGRSKPPEYALTADGILTHSEKQPLIRWRTIVSVRVTPDKPAPGHRTMTLHRKDGTRREITLPVGDLGDKVLADVQAQLPFGPPPANAVQLTRIDWAIAAAVTFAMLLGGGVLLERHAHSLRGSDVVHWIMAAGLLAGPGTWFAAALWRRRSHAALVPLAILMNLCSAYGIPICAILRHAMLMK
jgi:hypothetical protein